MAPLRPEANTRTTTILRPLTAYAPESPGGDVAPTAVLRSAIGPGYKTGVHDISVGLRVRWFQVSWRGDLGGGAVVPADGLSNRDVEELLAERGVNADHVTIYRGSTLHTGVRRGGADVPSRSG